MNIGGDKIISFLHSASMLTHQKQMKPVNRNPAETNEHIARKLMLNLKTMAKTLQKKGIDNNSIFYFLISISMSNYWGNKMRISLCEIEKKFDSPWRLKYQLTDMQQFMRYITWKQEMKARQQQNIILPLPFSSVFKCFLYYMHTHTLRFDRCNVTHSHLKP